MHLGTSRKGRYAPTETYSIFCRLFGNVTLFSDSNKLFSDVTLVTICNSGRLRHTIRHDKTSRWPKDEEKVMKDVMSMTFLVALLPDFILLISRN